jgi:hypothetical protein
MIAVSSQARESQYVAERAPPHRVYPDTCIIDLGAVLDLSPIWWFTASLDWVI